MQGRTILVVTVSSKKRKLKKVNFGHYFIQWPIGIIFDFFSCISIYAELFFRFRHFFFCFSIYAELFFCFCQFFLVFPFTQNNFFVSVDLFSIFFIYRELLVFFRFCRFFSIFSVYTDLFFRFCLIFFLLLFTQTFSAD